MSVFLSIINYTRLTRNFKQLRNKVNNIIEFLKPSPILCFSVFGLIITQAINHFFYFLNNNVEPAVLLPNFKFLNTNAALFISSSYAIQQLGRVIFNNALNKYVY